MYDLKKLVHRNNSNHEEPKSKGGPPKGNKNALKLPPDFPKANLNTIDGINTVLQELIKATWERRINNRTAAIIKGQLKLLKELLSSEVQGYTDEEMIIFNILSDDLKPYWCELLKHYEKILEENRPLRWTNDDTDLEYYYSIVRDFADKLPEKLKKPMINAIEKWERDNKEA